MRYPKILAVVANWRGANDWSFANGFATVGCNLNIIDVNRYFSNKGFVYRALKKVRGKPFNSIIDAFNIEILRTIDEITPEILFIAKGLWVKLETILYAKSKGIVVVHWHPDDAFNPENSSHLLDASIKLYDLLVTPKTFNIEEYKRVGARNVLYLPYAYDPSVHYPVVISGEEKLMYGSDLVFVGANRAKRSKELKMIVSHNLSIAIWGTGWHKLPITSSIKSHCKYRPVYAEEMSKVFQSSKISLGFLNAENRDLHTARTFEIPACRGFFLAERTSEQLEFFREGIEAEYFSSIEELIEKAKFYINNESLRQRIVEKGFIRVQQLNATYFHRASIVLKVLGF